MTAAGPTRSRLKVVTIQRVCPGYRVPLFRRLSESLDLDFRLFIGDDLPQTKVKNASDLGDIRINRLKTRFLRLGSRILPWHTNLISELRKFKPEVIVCEGESHFIGYLQAILYKALFDRHVALAHWCFITLPGDPDGGRRNFRFYVKSFFRRFFDAFVLYSSFGEESLLRLGQAREKLFVATNVGDTDRFLRLAESLPETKSQARERLGIPDRFTVIYLGTLDPNKRPDLFLELAKTCPASRFNFVLLGEGPLLAPLRAQAVREGLSHVFLRGRVTQELSLYLRAADTLLIPGRGGIIISEAMASGVPVVVHQADGTEYDLIQEGRTGLLVERGDLEAFQRALEWLEAHPELCREMGQNAQRLIAERFTTQDQALQVKKAAYFAAKRAPEVHTV